MPYARLLVLVNDLIIFRVMWQSKKFIKEVKAVFKPSLSKEKNELISRILLKVKLKEICCSHSNGKG